MKSISINVAETKNYTYPSLILQLSKPVTPPEYLYTNKTNMLMEYWEFYRNGSDDDNE